MGLFLVHINSTSKDVGMFTLPNLWEKTTTTATSTTKNVLYLRSNQNAKIIQVPFYPKKLWSLFSAFLIYSGWHFYLALALDNSYIVKVSLFLSHGSYTNKSK